MADRWLGRDNNAWLSQVQDSWLAWKCYGAFVHVYIYSCVYYTFFMQYNTFCVGLPN